MSDLIFMSSKHIKDKFYEVVKMNKDKKILDNKNE